MDDKQKERLIQNMVDNLPALRKRLDMTQADLAAKIGVTEDLWNTGLDKHCICGMSWTELLEVYKHPHAWVFEKPAWYEEPVAFTLHPGAVIWVKE